MCYSFVILFRLLLFQLCVVRSISFVNTIKCNANWQHSWIVWSKFKRSHTRLCLIGWAGSCLQIAVVCFLVKMYNNWNSKAAVKAEEKEREREKERNNLIRSVHTQLDDQKNTFSPFYMPIVLRFVSFFLAVAATETTIIRDAVTWTANNKLAKTITNIVHYS